MCLLLKHLMEKHLDKLAAIVIEVIFFLANLPIAIIPVFIEGRFLLLLSTPACDHWSFAATETPPPRYTETWLDESLECPCLFTAILTPLINLHLPTSPKQYSECCTISVKESVFQGDLQGLFCDAKWVWMWPLDMWCSKPFGCWKPTLIHPNLSPAG